MAGEINSLDDFIALIRASAADVHNGEWMHKYDFVEGAAAATWVTGEMHSLWRYSGMPSAGAVPTTWANPDNSTGGGWQQSNPGGSNVKRLVTLAMMTDRSASFLLYDRLGHIGGLDGTVITPQTFSGSLTRYNTNATCIGNMAFAEIYTTIGTTGSALSVSYTPESGTPGSVSGTSTFGGTGRRETHLFVPIRYANAVGDRGLQALADADLTVSTGTVGNFGITVGHPLATIGVNSLPRTGSVVINYAEAAQMPIIQPNACLALAAIGLTAAPRFTLFGSFIEGA